MSIADGREGSILLACVQHAFVPSSTRCSFCYRSTAPLPINRGHRGCLLLAIVVRGEFERFDRSGDGDAGRRDHDLSDEASRNHRYLFQDVCEWAGQVRMAEIAKDGNQSQSRQYDIASSMAKRGAHAWNLRI